MTTITRSVHFAYEGRRKRAVAAPPPATSGNGDGSGGSDATAGRVPRVARLMALAIRFDRLLRDGVVGSQSDLAAIVHVTQPRMTQIMNLLHLAPDIQEEILFLLQTRDGRDTIHEHMLRSIVSLVDWRGQRVSWKRMIAIGQTVTPESPS